MSDGGASYVAVATDSQAARLGVIDKHCAGQAQVWTACAAPPTLTRAGQAGKDRRLIELGHSHGSLSRSQA